MFGNFTIGSWNINGLGDKCKDDFFLSMIKYDINILLETWKGTDSEVNVPDYKLIQKCRKRKRRSKRYSGGIIIFYKSHLHRGIQELQDLTASPNRIWLKLDKIFFGFTKDLYICACYIPPVNSPHYDDDYIRLENEISQVSNRGNILVIGDLNSRIGNHLDFIDNEDQIHSTVQDLLPDDYSTDFYIEKNSLDNIFNAQGQQLIDLCIASQLRILNGRFIGDIFGNMTCFKPNGSSVVDYALTSMDLINCVNFFQTENPTYLSDHCQIIVHLKCKLDNQNVNCYTKCNTIESIFKWENVSKEKLYCVLEEDSIRNSILNFENTSFEENCFGVDQAESALNNIFHTLSVRSCKTIKTFKKKKKKKKKPWNDNELLDLRKSVSRLGNLLKNDPYNNELRTRFLKCSKDCKKLIKKKTQLYKKEIFDKLLKLKESDPKEYWKLLKSLKYEETNNTVELQAGFSELINHFKTQGQTDDYDKEFKDKVLSDSNLTPQFNELTDRPITVSELNRCVKKLKTGKSAGPDKISNEIIKYSGIVTCKAIVKLFNLIIDSGKYPTNWRKSFIILIHKSGDKLNVNNYRGISLQNCIAKLFSAVINSRLVDFYENKFADQQFGFRVNHRTTDSIFILKSLVTKYLIKRKNKIFSCFVDLRRAFDTVWHEGILYKLRENHVGLKLFNIVKDMYKCCESAVKIENKFSDFFRIERGVKQGDSLSPTLFNCFINDLHSVFDSTCDPVCLDTRKINTLSFADDLVILSESAKGLQLALKKLENYCRKWQLTVNIKKTKILIFGGPSQSNDKFFYKNEFLCEVKEFNFLGNIIDQKGKFKRSFQELSKKGLKAVFSLKKYMADFKHIPVNLSCKLFDALIRPIILYNSEVWFMDEYFTFFKALQRSIISGRNFDRLSLVDRCIFEKIHTRFCKSVLGTRKTACNLAARTELGRLPLEAFIKTQVITYYSRINSQDINPLVRESLVLNKKLSDDGLYTWYSFATSIMNDFDLEKTDFEYQNNSFKEVKYKVKNLCKNVIKENYDKLLLDKISKFDNTSKLHLYSKLKSEIGLSNYLKIPNFNSRKILTKFRISDHNLEVELGRYKRIPRDQRHCKVCKVLDDESHFLFHCQINSNLRHIFLNKILNVYPDFNQLDSFEKIQLILNPDMTVLSFIVDFLKQSLELRK